MIILGSTSDLLQVTNGAVVPIDIHASWVDNSASAVTPGRTNTTFNTATTVTVVGPPGAATQRNIKSLHVRNRDASNSTNVTIVHTDGVTAVQLYGATLAPGDAIEYTDAGGFVFPARSVVGGAGNYLQANVTAALVAGFTAVTTNVGTITGANQTYTPTPSSSVQNQQIITLNGSSLTGTFTFAPPASDCSVIVDVINGGSGAVGASLVTSGYAKVAGDTWSSANGSIYRFFASRLGGRSLLQIQAMQ